LVRGSAAMQRLCFQPLPLTIRDSQVSLPSPSGALLIWPTGTTPASRNLLSVIATANFRMGQQPSPSLTLRPSAASLLLLLLGRKSAGSPIFLAAPRKSSYFPSILRRTAPSRLWRTGEVTSSPRTGGGHSRRRSIYINGLSAAGLTMHFTNHDLMGGHPSRFFLGSQSAGPMPRHMSW